MKFKSLTVPAGLALSGVLVLLFFSNGCLLSKTATVSKGVGANGQPVFTTNIVTTVNQGNLAIWTTAAQGATVMGVNAVLVATKNDPKIISDLKTAKLALDGVISGANGATTQDILNALKANGDPTLTAEITNLVSSVSSLEQEAVVAAGSTPVGQITIAFAKAVDSGLSTVLQPFLVATAPPVAPGQ